MTLPGVDPLDERLRWCVHCRADCWPEPESQRHAELCPTRTGLYPVLAQDRDATGGYGACTACSGPFALGDRYVLVDAATGVTAPGPEVGLVVCVGCGALGRDPRGE